MINRELLTITVVTYSNGVDSYGQKKETTSSTRTVQAVIKPYNNRNFVDNPKFNDVEYIAITKDNSITDENRVMIGTVYYDVTAVILSGRYNQVFLKKYK